ncbi:hypothetical protein QFC21_004532 [Naganishia friedmannii]|uniref:Uncharacterized protein n=1 Tax=Naganishia friedmannii TaxID=89922 RepID=A0ACC2VGD3_9TREE|nr:hypothetical protein QFC21_004532 [Naganishia friedmannii]
MSPAGDIAPLVGGLTESTAMKQPKRTRSPQHTLASSSRAATQVSAAASSSRSLEEMKKRTRRLELMMEVMIEDNLNNGNMSSISSKARQRLEQHESLLDDQEEARSVEAELAKAASDANYANSTGFLPLAKLLEPEMVAWANPLEALGLEEQWGRICDVDAQSVLLRNVISAPSHGSNPPTIE